MRNDSVEEVKSQKRLISPKHHDNRKAAGVKVEAEKEKSTLNPENSSPGQAPESKDENTEKAKPVIHMGALGNTQLTKT